MSDNLNNDIGRRLRKIRLIYNEGFKISAQQFALIFGETNDKIVNYELGRAALPIKLLDALYHKGFNTNFIITGLEGIFASNEEGDRLKRIMKNRLIANPELGDTLFFNEFTNNFYFVTDNSLPLSAAAGKIELS